MKGNWEIKNVEPKGGAKRGSQKGEPKMGIQKGGAKRGSQMRESSLSLIAPPKPYS